MNLKVCVLDHNVAHCEKKSFLNHPSSISTILVLMAIPYIAFVLNVLNESIWKHAPRMQSAKTKPISSWSTTKNVTAVVIVSRHARAGCRRSGLQV